MRGMGLIFTPVLVRRPLGPPGLSRVILGLIATPNSPIKRHNLPLASHPPHPLPPVHPLIRAICDITVVVKKVA